MTVGASTAVVVPVAPFVIAGTVLARMLVGPDHRWLLPYSAVLAPILLIGSDVLGRLLAAPAELQVGIVTAFVGAPVFIALCLRRTVARA